VFLEAFKDCGRDHTHCPNGIGTERYTNADLSERGCGLVDGGFDMLGMREETNGERESGETTANYGEVDRLRGMRISIGN
jgi:hypothetical protein